jgi:hypothetical protein
MLREQIAAEYPVASIQWTNVVTDLGALHARKNPIDFPLRVDRLSRTISRYGKASRPVPPENSCACPD